MRSTIPTSSRSAPPRRLPAAPRCRLRPWCASPRRSASPASPNCRRCFARACATAGRTIPSASRRCSRTPATAAIPPISCSDLPIPRRPRSRGCAKRSSGASLTGRSAFWPRARTIHCLGQRRSFCVAHYLTYALSQLGIPASLIDNVGGLGPEQLAQAGAGDALIAISFSPYAPFTRRPRQAGAARRRSDRRRHRQRALAARRHRRCPVRDRRKRLRLVSLACGDILPGDDACGRRRRKAGGSRGLIRLLGGRPPGGEDDLGHEKRRRRDHERNREHRDEGQVKRLFERRPKPRIAGGGRTALQ